MNEKSRTLNSVRNVSVAVGGQLFTLIFSFITRWFFIKLLGNDYLGINGLYSNILTVLSMADLGIGTAIVYALYKPIADKDEKQIAAMMNFYKRTYRIIALVVAVVGLAVVPFLKYLVKTDKPVEHLVLYYILFLANTVCSYLLAYKSSMLNADQRNDIVKTTNTVFNILANIGELAVLILTHNYIFYLVVQIVCTLSGNLVISHRVNKMYPFIKKYKSEQITNKKRQKIFVDIKAFLSYKISGVIINNTDNILISSIIGTAFVGYYSNYYLVVGAILTLSQLAFGAMTGSVGSLNARFEIEKSQKIFNTINFLGFIIYGFSSVCLYNLLSDFVRLWLGESMVLSQTVVIAIVLSLYLPGSLCGVMAYRETTGLFRQTKYIIAITAVLNIILSVLLGKYLGEAYGKEMGMAGILFATSASRILSQMWYEPYKLYKSFFKKSISPYVIRQGMYFLTTVICCILMKLATGWVNASSVMGFILKAVICAFGTAVIFFVLYFKTDEFKELKNRAFTILKIKQNKRS